MWIINVNLLIWDNFPIRLSCN